MKKRKPLILGHRGYSALYPENTLQAFVKAIECGADGIELDIHKNKAGEFYVLHDVSLERIAGIDVNISDLDYIEINKIRTTKNITLPTLKDVLKNIHPTMQINIELKETISSEDYSQINEIITTFHFKDNIIISSFNHSLLKSYSSLGLKTAELFEEKDLNNKVKSLFLMLFTKTDFVHLPIEFFSYFNKKVLYLLYIFLKIQGKGISFYTVNTVEDYNKIKQFSFAIITDEVELMIKNTSALIVRKST